jgi:hypothetical protein
MSEWQWPETIWCHSVSTSMLVTEWWIMKEQKQPFYILKYYPTISTHRRRKISLNSCSPSLDSNPGPPTTTKTKCPYLAQWISHLDIHNLLEQRIHLNITGVWPGTEKYSLPPRVCPVPCWSPWHSVSSSNWIGLHQCSNKAWSSKLP